MDMLLLLVLYMVFCYSVLAPIPWGKSRMVIVYIGASYISREKVDIWSVDILAYVIFIMLKNHLQSCHCDLLC